jgi:ABC-2 type transport system ATP-binding protein
MRNNVSTTAAATSEWISTPLDDRATKAPAVLVEDVTKSFPVSLAIADWIRYRGAVPRRTVLHNISFRVRAGELFGLLGPNGAGKTTLLKMLATLCTPDQGRIFISGIDASRRPMAVKRKIGLCTSEERSFYYRLTARQNLRFFGSLCGLYGDMLDHRVEEVIALVDLGSAVDRRFDSFSSGMRQRLSLARAILGNPDIIFLDEPTRAVDPLHAHEIRKFIREELVVRQGKTAVLATNMLDEAWAICDTVTVVQHGRIVASGSPQTLNEQFTRFARYRITSENSSDELIRALRAIAGMHNVSSQRVSEVFVIDVEFDPANTPLHKIFQTLATGGSAVKSLRSEDPRPLDVFLGLTQDGNAS